ncbi:cytidine deaminase [Aeromicrobium sp.]|uniref:cytidine deaminase n=1 Tax=Aeromicrobium sp. TaxID=1871063 RepID=UPI0030BE70B1
MELSPEDAKLVTLARASRARVGAAEGAAVRDLDGRTYAASTVRLESLQIEALDLAVAMAVCSGAKGLEGAAVITESGSPSTSSVRDLGGPGISVFVADPSGVVGSVRES